MDHQDTVPQPQPMLRKKPVDQWSIRERLALASAVCQSGDQNWVSVSRAIRPFAELGRRSDWFSQKNCAVQYADLLEKVETPKRKRSERGEIIETPGTQIFRKLTVDRLEELKVNIVDCCRQTKKLKTEIEMVNSGHCDEKLAEIWEQIQLRQKEKEEKAAAALRALDEDRKARAAQKGRQQTGGNMNAEFDDSSTQDSALSDNVDVEEPSSAIMAATSQSMNIGGQHQSSSMVLAGSSASVDSKSRDTPPPPPSHLLTTLLQKKTPLDMSRLLKDDVNKHDGPESLLCPTPKKMDHQPVLPGVTPSAGAPTLTMLLNTSSSGASMGIRQVPGAAVAAATATAVVAASTTLASSIASTVPAGVQPVGTSTSVIGTAAGTPVLESLGMPTILTLPTIVVPAVSQASILVVPVSREPSSPPVALPPDSDMFTDAATSISTSDTIETLTEQPLRLPVSIDIDESVPAETKQPLEVCVDVDEAPAASSEVVVENEIVATDHPLEADSSMEHCQAAVGDTEPVTESVAAACPQTLHQYESVAVLPAEDQELVAAISAAAEAMQPETSEAEQLVQATAEACESHVPIEQLPTDAAAAPTITASVAPPSPSTAAPAPASAPAPPPSLPPIAVQPPMEEVPAITTESADAPQEPVMPAPICTEVLELKPLVDKPVSSPDVAEPSDVALVLAGSKQASKTSTAKRSTDASRSRRRSRSSKKTSESVGADEASVTEQLTATSATAAGATSEEASIISVLPTTASEDIHRETHQPEACIRSEDQNTEIIVPVSEEITSEQIKDMTNNAAVVQADAESKVSAHVDLISPSVSAASIESSAPLLAAASPGASSAADISSVPTPLGELASMKHLPVAAGSSAESLPCSPASVPLSDDSEEEKSYKIWRKAITLVWRSVANHKYANVFLHPVTDDIAPGYTSCVYRPMDLQTIKKNIENGTIRTTAEFQRDMMLMFTNAIMYNDTNHDVYKMAMEMYDDAMQHIEQFVHTQLMLKEQETKVVSLRGRRDAPEKDDDKRRPAYDHGEGGKRKRTRADDDK